MVFGRPGGRGYFSGATSPDGSQRSSSASSFALDIAPKPHAIDSSVGSFDIPNPYEAKVAGEMLDDCVGTLAEPAAC